MLPVNKSVPCTGQCNELSKSIWNNTRATLTPRKAPDTLINTEPDHVIHFTYERVCPHVGCETVGDIQTPRNRIVPPLRQTLIHVTLQIFQARIKRL